MEPTNATASGWDCVVDGDQIDLWIVLPIPPTANDTGVGEVVVGQELSECVTNDRLDGSAPPGHPTILYRPQRKVAPSAFDSRQRWCHEPQPEPQERIVYSVATLLRRRAQGQWLAHRYDPFVEQRGERSVECAGRQRLHSPESTGDAGEGALTVTITSSTSRARDAEGNSAAMIRSPETISALVGSANASFR